MLFLWGKEGEGELSFQQYCLSHKYITLLTVKLLEKMHLVVSLRNHPSGVKEKRRGGKGVGDSISRKRFTTKSIFLTRGEDCKNLVLQKSA